MAKNKHNDKFENAAAISVYIDTNIFLNIIYKEKEFQNASSELLRQIQEDKISGITAAVTAFEMILDIDSRGFGQEISTPAVSTLQDIRSLSIVSLDFETCREAARYVLKNKLTIHDSYHLASALRYGASLFVTRDQSLAKKIKNYIRVVKPEELLEEVR